jgi:pimeloyl-ACP methyl ester carboxylesterase
MGGFVGAVLAASRPELVERLVLVDGGLPLPVPEGADPDAILEAILGPSIERLRRTFPSREAYMEFWRPHPALQGEWNGDVEAYLDYDLTGREPELRSKVSEEAVRADGAATLKRASLIASALESLRCPVVLVRAPRDVMNRPTPLQPDELVAQWKARVPQLEDELVEDTNHYTIVFGERGAKIIAEHVRAGGPG